MTDIMKYSAAGIGQLLSELQTYQQQLSGQEDDAKTYSTNLQAVWEGGGKDAFVTQHNILMGDLDNILGILGGGIAGVNSALTNAQVADGQVAISF
jgi:uncharacterized protein YukE